MTTASPRTKALCILLSPTISVAIAALALAQAPASPHDLSDAVLQGDVEKAQQLIAAGADLEVLDDRTNPNGRYPLNWAAWNNNVEMIEVLLDAGADVSKPNRTGFTPLHHAIENGSTEAAELLVERGADLSAVNRFDLTPLQFAREAGRAEIERIILAAQEQ